MAGRAVDMSGSDAPVGVRDGNELVGSHGEELTVVVPIRADGQKRRGARYKPGESSMTGSSQKRAQQEVYIQWLATPEPMRDPRTKVAMAELLGVTARTLNLWEKDPWLMRKLLQETKNSIQVKKVSSILESLYATATDTGSSRQVAAAKVLLDYSERKVEEVSAEELREMPADELADLLFDLQEMIVDGQ